ncbi:MAG: 2-aminoethylphosphonate--pyruvate transaminase, partial [Pseudomonadota bacterium]
LGRSAIALSCAEDRTPDLTSLETLLAEDKAITHIAAVHCETTSGILNPIQEIADIVAKRGRSLIIDAMSAFGAIPLDVKTVTCDAVVASSNKCLEGVPGMGYAIIRRTVLEQCEGNAHSLALDIYDQWRGLESNGQWRFTPPTHVLAAFDQAVAEFGEEGGVPARNARYSENCRTLVGGMREMGFETLLPDDLQAPIIITFHMPGDPKFDFAAFYDRLAARGYVIYPGKLTVAPTFRIGCIGQMVKEDLEAALAVIREVLGDMGVTQCGPAKAAAE